MSNEVWKPIDGYEGLYECSTEGRVKSLLNKNNPLILKPRIDKDGYLKVILYKKDGGIEYRVHVLIARTFIPNPNNLPQVNHINEVKDDNNVNNLEWCDAKYNDNFGARNSKISQSKMNNPKTSKSIQEILDDGTIKNYPSLREAERQGRGGHSNISDAIETGRKFNGSYWKYI